MSPAQKSSRLREIATRIRCQRQHIVAAELAIQGIELGREEINFRDQVAAVSELLQSIAQHLDEFSAGILHDAENEEQAA